MRSRLRLNLSINIVTVIAIATAAILFDNKKQMSPVWTVPYFSGATNHQLGKEWLYDPMEVDRYKELTYQEKVNYKFPASQNLVPYDANPFGYLYVVQFAKKCFFWLGDIKAIKYFQVAVHILLSLLIIFHLNEIRSKILFILLYGINPLIIYFTTMPYYFFWQVVPSSICAILFLRKDKLNYVWCISVPIILALIYIIRPTTLFISLLSVGIIILKRRSYLSAVIALTLFLGTIYAFQGNRHTKNPWFTMYVGIGAYPNNYMKGLTDNNGYRLYKKYTGTEIDASPGGNYYTREVVLKFREITKDEYLMILKTSPFLLIKNAILNFFQAFSIGYFADYPLWVSYLSAVAGIIYFTLLFYKKYYWWMVAIACSSLSFTPYYPPIQAYMFGAYILLVCAFVQLLSNYKGQPEPVLQKAT